MNLNFNDFDKNVKNFNTHMKNIVLKFGRRYNINEKLLEDQYNKLVDNINNKKVVKYKLYGEQDRKLNSYVDQLSDFNNRINDNDLKYTMINTLQYLEKNGTIGVLKNY